MQRIRVSGFVTAIPGVDVCGWYSMVLCPVLVALLNPGLCWRD